MKTTDSYDKHQELKCLLREKGYSRYSQRNGINKRWFLIVRAEGMILTPVKPELLLPLVMAVFGDCVLDKFSKKSIADSFSEDLGLLQAYLEETLDDFDGDLLCDTDVTTYLFFSNVALAVTAKEIVEIQYDDLSGYIWKSQIVDHSFDLQSVETSRESKFFDFIQGLCYCPIEAVGEERVCHLSSIMGAMLNNSNTVKFEQNEK